MTATQAETAPRRTWPTSTPEMSAGRAETQHDPAHNFRKFLNGPAGPLQTTTLTDVRPPLTCDNCGHTDVDVRRYTNPVGGGHFNVCVDDTACARRHTDLGTASCAICDHRVADDLYWTVDNTTVCRNGSRCHSRTNDRR